MTNVEMNEEGRVCTRAAFQMCIKELTLHDEAHRRPQQQASPLNMNTYANKKSVAESMLDIALLIANVSQLKAVINEESYIKNVIFWLIITSIFFQLLVACLLICIVMWNLNDQHKQMRLNCMESFVLILVIIILILNIAITTFGFPKPHVTD